MAVFALFWGLFSLAYKSLNNAGWISHRTDTAVRIDGNWMVGEYRACLLAAKPTWLDCNTLNGIKGEDHTLPVTYQGRIDRDVPSAWKCQLQRDFSGTDSLDCRSLN